VQAVEEVIIIIILNLGDSHEAAMEDDNGDPPERDEDYLLLDEDEDDEVHGQVVPLEDLSEVENSSTESSNLSEEDENDGQAEGEEEGQRFDRELPGRHMVSYEPALAIDRAFFTQYLGQANEVSGRIILEEGRTQELVLVPHRSVILLPGQTLPMAVFHPTEIAQLKRLIQSVKTFASVYVRTTARGEMNEANVGTTAEIFEFREADEETEEVGFKIKVKGRQRFKIIDYRRTLDGYGGP